MVDQAQSAVSESGGGWLGIGAVFAAIGASICCVVPVVVAFMGVGSAAFSVYFVPFRPYLIGITVLLLGFAFYRAYRPQQDCEPGDSCAVPANRGRQRLLLWIITFVTIALLTFPYYINLIL